VQDRQHIWKRTLSPEELFAIPSVISPFEGKHGPLPLWPSEYIIGRRRVKPPAGENDKAEADPKSDEESDPSDDAAERTALETALFDMLHRGTGALHYKVWRRYFVVARWPALFEHHRVAHYGGGWVSFHDRDWGLYGNCAEIMDARQHGGEKSVEDARVRNATGRPSKEVLQARALINPLREIKYVEPRKPIPLKKKGA